MSSQSSAAVDVFDAAKTIVATLKDLEKEAQMQAIRFASESLGLSPALFSQALAVPISNVAPSTPVSPESGGGERRSMDIRQFTEAKVPKSDQQFTAVVAYFYQLMASPSDRRDTINPATLKEAARQAGWHQVKDWAMTLNNAKYAGYLDSVGRGEYKLNSVGENLVAITLPGNGTVESPKHRATRKTRAKRKFNK